jgi:ketosteroid isomerase-like protein
MDVIERYVQSWINDYPAGVRRLIAPDADIDWNFDAPVDDEELVQTLHRIAAFADSVTVVARTGDASRAVLLYDLAAPFGTARLVEFLAVRDNHITEVRQVYDAVAIDRFFPGLYAN